MHLNAEWYKICYGCGLFWCSKGKNCEAQDCRCLDYVTTYMFRKNEVQLVLCGPCRKQFNEWLAKNEPTSTVLTFRLMEHYHDDDEAQDAS